MSAENIEQLEKFINELGENLLKCNEICEGISNNKKRGIIPRCLYLENRGEYEKGCVVVGINPGISTKKERADYLKIADLNYEDVKSISKSIIDSHKYYNQTRKFLEAIDLKGPILWTELVKCENKDKRLPPIQTFRVCTKNYLTEEIKHIPINWPLIAVGKIAYNALSFLYPKKAVIGIPHPTGSYGYFDKLIDGKIIDEVLKDVKKSMNNNAAIWLTHKNI